ncbi:hypothetical protein FNAPI_12016 [Fusarium napiforme]|uniref:DUF7924 domain-containing protein n=1 Tax=Fusarium napiforme TaxID=42672 RepID=A0A8H5MP02_9HYPO|nr:hypothetical protein FNAPI_12016 [Fusarium napiforme]
MPPNKREIQRQLMEKYNIIFDGPIDSITDPQWPKSCNQVFHDIRQLGKTEYEGYHASISADSSQTPWRIQAKVRAESIRERVKRCIRARKNEISWRLAIETRIMARFDTEIACKRCRGRFWRSEQEVTSPSNSVDDDYNSLRARQRRRQPCLCSSNDTARDIFEQGTSPLFDDKAEQAIIYPPELLADLPKREERPDRIYGLKATKRFRRLLELVPGTRTAPFKPDGEPIIFPFLVIEAKSEKGGYNFSDIQIQTSFVIRELLSIQQELASVAEEGQDWDAGPLVWSLSYMGEQWRVSAAYTQGQGNRISYHVVRLWHGCIDSLDDALRLLLIIDYIADWARDLYREGIACSLQKLAACDSSSLARDEDVASLSGKMGTWLNSLLDTNRDTVDQVLRDPLHECDTEAGVFRDPRFVRSECVGLVITHNNVEEFLRTEPTNNAAGNLISRLIDNLKGACRMTGRLLNDLEVLWTDTDRDLSDSEQPEETFYVVATTVFYLNSNWEPIRELSYLAVSQRLISDSARIAPEALGHVYELEKARLVEKIDAFGDLLGMSAEDNLSACLFNFCLRTDTTSGAEYGIVWKALTEGDQEDDTRPQIVLRSYMWPKARLFITDIHSMYTIGRNELKMPFLRTSSAMDRTKVCIFVLDASFATTGIPIPQISGPPRKHIEIPALSENYDTAIQGRGLFSGHRLFTAWNAAITTSDNPYMLKGILDRFIDSLKRQETSQSISKWDRITTGWAIDQDAQPFDLTCHRPFERQVCQNSVSNTLLKVEKSSDPLEHDERKLPELDIDDENCYLAPFFPGSTVTRPSDTSESMLTFNISSTTSTQPPKRKRGMMDLELILDEPESSAYAERRARQQQETTQRLLEIVRLDFSS